MPRIFPVIRKVIVQGGGGNVPPGAAVMTDDVRLAATVFVGDVNPAPTDAGLVALSATYAESAATPSDVVRLGLGTSETLAGGVDDLLIALRVTYPEAVLTPADNFLIGIGTAEQIAATTEALRLGVTQADLAAAQADALTLGLTQADVSAAQVDASTQQIFATYAELVATQTEAARLALGVAESVAATSDAARVGLTVAEQSAAQSELLRVGLLGFAEVNPAATELVKAAIAGSGLAEASPAPGDSKTATVFTYVASQVSSGNGATSGASCIGPPDGVNASILSVALGNTVNSITATIPRASVPNAGSYTLFAWYFADPGSVGSIVARYTNTSGVPETIALPQSVNSLTTPFQAAITSLHATNDITLFFQTADPVAGVTQAGILIDAVAIRTQNAF